MKTQLSILLGAGILLSISSCKKDAFSNQKNPVAGKWYVNKMYVKLQSTNNNNVTITRDTTYISNNFTTYDYLTFEDDSLASISGNGVFYPGSDIVKSTAIAAVPYIYFTKGSLLTLRCSWIPYCPANLYGCTVPVFIDKILQLDAHNLVIESVVMYNSLWKATTDTYYIK